MNITGQRRWTSTLLDSWMVSPNCAIERRKWDYSPVLPSFYRLVGAGPEGPVVMLQANNIEAVLAFLDRLNRVPV